MKVRPGWQNVGGGGAAVTGQARVTCPEFSVIVLLTWYFVG